MNIKDDDESDTLEEVFDFNNVIIVRDEKGRCWALSPGNFLGNIEKDKLKSIGKFKVTY